MATVAGLPTFAFGWLDGPTIPTAPQLPGVKETLLAWVEDSGTIQAQTRGFHSCPYCGGAKSSSELWLLLSTGASQELHRAPRMAAHYVAAHGYSLPLKLQEGILSGLAQPVQGRWRPSLPIGGSGQVELQPLSAGRR